MADRYTVASARRALASLATCMELQDDLYLDVLRPGDGRALLRAERRSNGATPFGAARMSSKEAYIAFQAAEAALRLATITLPMERGALSPATLDAMMQERRR